MHVRQLCAGFTWITHFPELASKLDKRRSPRDWTGIQLRGLRWASIQKLESASTILMDCCEGDFRGSESTGQASTWNLELTTAQQAPTGRVRTNVAVTSASPALPRLLVKKRQAAEMLDMSPATIDRWIAAGHLEKVVFGTRHVRVTMASIERMIGTSSQA